jgi:hypothetical protein
MPRSFKLCLSCFSQFFHACFMPYQFVLIELITLMYSAKSQIMSLLLIIKFLLLPKILLSIMFKHSIQNPVLSTLNLRPPLNRRDIWKYTEISPSLKKKDTLKFMCRCKTIHLPLMTEKKKAFMTPISCIL